MVLLRIAEGCKLIHDLFLVCLGHFVGLNRAGADRESGRSNAYRVFFHVIRGKEFLWNLAVEVTGYRKPEAVQQSGSHIDYTAQPDFASLHDAWSSRDEDPLGIMRAHQWSLFKNGTDIGNGDKTRVPKHKCEVRRIAHRESSEYVLALVDLADDRYSFIVPKFAEICDEPLPESLVLVPWDSRIARI